MPKPSTVNIGSLPKIAIVHLDRFDDEDPITPLKDAIAPGTHEITGHIMTTATHLLIPGGRVALTEDNGRTVHIRTLTAPARDTLINDRWYYKLIIKSEGQ